MSMGKLIENLLPEPEEASGWADIVAFYRKPTRARCQKKKNSQLLALHTSITSSFDTSLVVEKISVPLINSLCVNMKYSFVFYSVQI